MTLFNMKKEPYRIQVMDGFTIETEEGYQPPEEMYTAEFCYFRDALKHYKEAKAENLGAVIFFNRDGSIRHFKKNM